MDYVQGKKILYHNVLSRYCALNKHSSFIEDILVLNAPPEITWKWFKVHFSVQNEQPGTAKICVIFVTRPFIAQTTAINSISLCPTRIAMPAVHIHLIFFSELFWNSMLTGKIAKHFSTATCDTAQKYRTATFSLTVRRLALARNK